MTTTEKQKCIAEQSVYGDLMLNRRAYDDVEEKYIIEQVDSKWVLDFINYDKLLSLTPILRHLSDLTKIITHKGYNEDQPFVPLVALAKVSHPDCIKYELDIDSEYIGVKCIYDGDSYTPFIVSKNHKYISAYILDLLHLWHFDTRNLIEQGEAVDINSLDINPYEV